MQYSQVQEFSGAVSIQASNYSASECIDSVIIHGQRL
jgi:hypothetical protein